MKVNLKLSKTAIRELTKRYRAVLMAALVAGAVVATGANAADGDLSIATDGTVTGTNSSGSPITLDASKMLTTDNYATTLGSVYDAKGAAAGVQGSTTETVASVDAKIATLNGSGAGSVSKSISDAITALDLANTYDAKGAAAGVASDLLAAGDNTSSIAYALGGTTSSDTLTSVVQGIATTQANSAIETSINTAGKALNTALADKQDTLSAGSGINIATDGKTISVSGITTSNIASNANIAKTQLASDVQTSLGKADSAVQSVTAGSANGTISVDGTDVSVTGLDAAAYRSVVAKDTTDASGVVTSNYLTAQNYTTLADVVNDATNTASGRLGAAVLTTVVNDAGNTTSGHLGAAIKATKVDSAASADAVTSSAVDNSTIVLSGGKLSVGEIAQGKVTGLTTALDNISVSTSNGVVTVQDDEGHNANVYDTTTVDTKTTVTAQATSTAGYGANTAVTTAVTNLDTALGHAESGMENLAAQLGVTYTKSTGAVTSTNYSSENFITDGNTVVDAIGKLDGAIGGTITSSGFLNGTELGSGTGKSSVKDVLQSVSNTIGTVDFSSGKNTTATDLTTAIKDLDKEIGADDDYGTGTLNNGVLGTNSVKANIKAVNNALGNVADVAVNGYDASTGTLVGAVSKLDTNMEAVLGNMYASNGTYTAFSGDGFVKTTGTDTLTSQLTAYAANVEKATGGTFNPTTGAWSGTVSNAAGKKTAYVYSVQDNLIDAISNVAANIGTADELKATNKSGTAADNVNGVTKDKTVNANLTALNNIVGDFDGLHKSYTEGASEGNAMTNGGAKTPANVVDALNNIDATLGTIHGLNAKRGADAKGNLATGTTVEDHLVALDDAIGDRSQFNKSNYLQDNAPIANAVMSLDRNLHRVEKEMKGGFASVAAMSALQPNARAAGDTQISVGAGAYRDHQGLAIGAFHYFNDNIMANIGASYAGDRSTMVRAGVTFGW